jgi:hypothetical protein
MHSGWEGVMQEAALYTIRAGQDGVMDLQWWPGSSSMFGVATQGGTLEAGPCIQSRCIIPFKLNRLSAAMLQICSQRSKALCVPPMQHRGQSLVSVSLSSENTKENPDIFSSQLGAAQLSGPPQEGQVMSIVSLNTHQ